MLLPCLSSHQHPSQTMVEAGSHAETDGFAGNQRPFLQTCLWKHERNIQHEKGNNEQSQEFVT